MGAHPARYFCHPVHTGWRLTCTASDGGRAGNQMLAADGVELMTSTQDQAPAGGPEWALTPPGTSATRCTPVGGSPARPLMVDAPATDGVELETCGISCSPRSATRTSSARRRAISSAASLERPFFGTDRRGMRAWTPG
jgi:hypothetical protein